MPGLARAAQTADMAALSDAFQWAGKLVAALKQMFGDEHLRHSALCMAPSSSSFFSGMGTAELAWKAVGVALRAHSLPFRMEPVFAVDIDEAARATLLHYGFASHVLGDIMDMVFVPEFNSASPFSRQVDVILRAPVNTQVWCFRNRAFCRIDGACVDTSGSPCQDWSRAGLQQGIHGPRVHAFLAWVRWHLVWGTPIIVHENVPQFDMNLLHTFMGAAYHIFSVVCGPEHVGFGFCRRDRRYVALVHRSKCHLMHNPEMVFAAVSAVLRTTATVRDLYLASDEEVRAEESMLAQQRGLDMRPGPITVARAAVIGRAGAAGPVAAHSVSSLQYLLTGPEQERLSAYHDLWQAKFGSDPHTALDLIVNLGDNPRAGWVTWSAPSSARPWFCIPTLRRHWTVQWIPALDRWLTMRERLAMMGFPAYPALAQVYGFQGSFSMPWDVAKNLVGNGMHVACVGVWQTVVAACVKLR